MQPLVSSAESRPYWSIFATALAEAVAGSEAVFELLKEGKYKFRAILDANGNGIWDTGLYLKKRQPEEIIYLPVEISVRPNFDIEQTFDLKGTGESSGEAQKK